MLRTPTFYLMWVGYALGCSAGLMVISQLVPFAKSVGIAAAALSTMTLVVGAFGNASGRILSGWMSDRLGRINVLRTMIGICMVAMPALYAAGSNVALLYVAVFVVYWCYGTQLSVNGVAASDFWGTKNAGINYGILFTAWGVAGIIGPRIGGVLYDRYHNYQAAFYTAAGLAAIALLCELGARRPAISALRKQLARRYSLRSAITGSIRVARRAGSHTAMSDTRLSRTAAVAKTAGSLSFTPNSSVASSLRQSERGAEPDHHAGQRQPHSLQHDHFPDARRSPRRAPAGCRSPASVAARSRPSTRKCRSPPGSTRRSRIPSSAAY